jgi:hypothetical protein
MSSWQKAQHCSSFSCNRGPGPASTSTSTSQPAVYYPCPAGRNNPSHRRYAFGGSLRQRVHTRHAGGTLLHPQAEQATANLQFQGTLNNNASPSDIFQSALNALDLFDPLHQTAPRVEEELHEDINVEQGQAAAQVGRSVYEVGTRYSLQPVLIIVPLASFHSPCGQL